MRLDRLDRVDSCAERLRHAPAIGSLDDRGDVDVAERDFAAELESHHDHPRDPQRDDVAPGDQHLGGIESAELVGLRRPTKCHKRPQGTREPSVQHILVLAQRTIASAAALGRARRDIGLLASVAVVHRQAMAPPQLAGDAPRPDLLHPVEVNLAPALGEEADVAALDCVDRRLRKLVHAHEPLERDERLDA